MARVHGGAAAVNTLTTWPDEVLRRPLLLIVLAAVLSTASCGGTTFAAHVGDMPVSVASLNAEISEIDANAKYVAFLERSSHASVRDAAGKPTRGFVAGVLTRRINYEVLAQEVRARHLVVSRDQTERGAVTAADDAGGQDIFDAFDTGYRHKLIRRDALLAALSDALISGVTPESYYGRYASEFVKACSRHILVATRLQAIAARSRIVAGAPFDRVAKEVSIDGGTAPKGGDLGCNGAGDLTPKLDRASFAQKVGVVGQPLPTQAGWQLLLVSSRHVPSLEGVHGEVSAAIVKLAKARVGLALERRIARIKVEVSDRYGIWEPNQRKVIVR